MKKWYLSKTLWFNVLALVAVVSASFGYTGELPAEVMVYVPAIVALINLVLRFVTKEPVG
jgi:uncharacterized membrane protein